MLDLISRNWRKQVFCLVVVKIGDYDVTSKYKVSPATVDVSNKRTERNRRKGKKEEVKEVYEKMKNWNGIKKRGMIIKWTERNN